MDTSTDLFDLIKSMTKSEKGYFKKSAQLHTIGKKNNYVALFDAILKQEVYDEDAILKKFRKESFAKNFPVAKSYLNDLAVKSLRHYHASSNIYIQVNNLLSNAHILNIKGLNHAALKELKKAGSIAEKYDLPQKKIECLGIELSFQSKRLTHEANQRIDELMQELKEWSARYDNFLHYQEFYQRAGNIIRASLTKQSPENQQIIENIINDESMKDDALAIGFYAKVAFHGVWNIYHYLMQTPEKAVVHSKKILDLWSSYENIRASQPVAYLSAMNNHLMSVIHLDDMTELGRCIEELDSLKWDSPSAQAAVFEHSTLTKLNFLLRTCQYEILAEFVKELEDDLKKFSPQLSKGKDLSFRYCLGIYYVASTQDEAALPWLEEVIDYKHQEFRHDVQDIARLVHLLVHFRLENDLLLDSLVRSYQRYFQGRDRDNLYINWFFKNFNRIRKAVNKEECRERLLEMKKEHQELLKEHPELGPFGAAFHFEQWIDAQVFDKSMLDVARESYEEEMQRTE